MTNLLEKSDYVDSCLKRLSGFVFSHINNFHRKIKLEDGSIKRFNPEFSYGKIFENGRVAFFTKPFKEICRILEIDAVRLIYELYWSNCLEKATFSKKAVGVRVDNQTIRAYIFKEGLIGIEESYLSDG